MRLYTWLKVFTSFINYFDQLAEHKLYEDAIDIYSRFPDKTKELSQIYHSYGDHLLKNSLFEEAALGLNSIFISLLIKL